jgi:hypothetical protein
MAMKQMIFVLIGTLAAGLSQGYLGQIRSAESDNKSLDRSVGRQNFEGLTTTGALLMSLTIADVPGGIAVRQGCSDPKRPLFKQSGPTLRNALDSIVAADPTYKWTSNRGVVNLVPSAGDPPLLKLRIRKFYIQNASTAREVVDQLLMMPEVRKHALELGLRAGYVRLGMSDLGRSAGTSKPVSKLTLKVENVTIREALNEIARAHGTAVWAYTERRCHPRNEFSVDLLRQ